jgi:hypothetical protein
MWRALFLAIGLFLMIVGLQCLMVDRVLLKLREEPLPAAWPFDTSPKVGAAKQIIPPPWAPWSLISSGAVVCLYSFTIPRRVSGN